jgi:hypothetical protein
MQRLFKLWLIFVGVISVSLSKYMIVNRNRLALACPVIILLAVMVVLPTAILRGQTLPQDTLRCKDTVTIDLGGVLAGATVHDTLPLLNLDSSNDSDFNIITNGNSGFSWTSSPHLYYNQTTNATIITFSASDTTLGLVSSTMVFQPKQDTLCETVFKVRAEAVGPDTDNSIVALNQSSYNIIAFKSDTSNQTLQIEFQTDDTTSLHIDTLILENDTSFSILPSSIKFPDTLPAGGSFSLKLAFIAKKPGFYTDFISAPDHSILPLSVQGQLEPKSSVLTQPNSSIYFALYPNPSNGPVTIHTQNISQTHATITDVLGRTMTQSSFTGDWQWDRSGANGIAPAGTYFIEVTAIGMNGEHIHRVERVVLE